MAGYVESQALLQDVVPEILYNGKSDNDDVSTNKKGSEKVEGAVALGRNIHLSSSSNLEIKEAEYAGEKEAYIAVVFKKYMTKWLERIEHHLGYPFNLDFNYEDLGQLQQLPLNNLGDPFVEGNYGVHSRDFEVGVLDWFANLWDIGKDKYWGYVTNGGTEGNLHGILVGREVFPEGILYASKESHYSIFKAARMCRMNCNKIETLVSGEIDCSSLKTSLLQNKDKPAILNINIGTTVKGGVDDLDLVIQTLKECGFPRNRFYIHCDGALFGLMLPFLHGAPQVTFKKQIDSVSVSGHKFVGSPMPCGVQIVRIEHINALSKDVEYIASRDATVTGSRNGHAPIFLWYALNRRGHRGFHKEVQECMHNARYLKDRLREAGVSVMLNELSTTVVFERPPDEQFIRRWQLSCEGKIAHVVVLLHVTIDKLNTFVDELIQKRSIWFKGNTHPPCVAFEIGNDNCVCSLHK